MSDLIPQVDNRIPFDYVTQWVGERIGCAEWGRCSAVAVTIPNPNRRLVVAGVVLSDFCHRDKGVSAQLSIASISPRWCTRRVVHEIFTDIFHRTPITRLWMRVRRGDKRLRKLAERFGFRLEGIARADWDGEQDAAIYSMLHRECTWLVPKRTRLSEAA